MDGAPIGAAVAILTGDETLRTAFLLRNPRGFALESLDEERAARFLLWFAAGGHQGFRHACFGPAYVAWLNEPAGPYPSRLAAWLVATRPDLRQRFGRDIAAFARWFETEGAAELGVLPLTLPAGTLPGVNIIGFAGNVMGIGEDARALATVLRHAGVPVAICNLTLPETIGTAEHDDLAALHVARPIFPLNIFAIPPFETARLFAEEGAALFHGRYNIGFWPWELTSVPPGFRHVFRPMDEIWAASGFLQDVYRRLTDKPVVPMSPAVLLPEPRPFSRGSVGLTQENVVFLTMFDFNSFSSRKNPLGAIRAFRSAFTERNEERLIVKSINGHAHPDALAALRAEIGDDTRILLIDQAYSRAETLGLIAACDVLLSLHRAEGFGRVLAEAMALGTVVIATDWSGSRDFLDATTGYPVACRLIDVPADDYIYAAGSRWAEPSIDDAVLKLRQARDHLRSDGALRRRAAASIAESYGLEPVTQAVTGRLTEIAAKLRGR